MTTRTGLVVGGISAGERLAHDSPYLMRQEFRPVEWRVAPPPLERATIDIRYEHYEWQQLTVVGDIEWRKEKEMIQLWRPTAASFQATVQELLDGYRKPLPEDCNHRKWYGLGKCPACGADKP